MTADLDDVDTDFDFVKKKRDSKQKRKTYGVPKIDFTNDKVTDILKWRIIVEQINRYKTILGVSADVLAKEAKLSKPTVLKLLHGDTTVQVGNVLKVLNALEHRRKNWFKKDAE